LIKFRISALRSLLLGAVEVGVGATLGMGAEEVELAPVEVTGVVEFPVALGRVALGSRDLISVTRASNKSRTSSEDVKS
jgi:hypothetical protein